MDNDQHSEATRVALTFMKKQEQFERELSSRAELDDDASADHVVGITRHLLSNTKNDSSFVDSIKEYRQGGFV